MLDLRPWRHLAEGRQVHHRQPECIQAAIAQVLQERGVHCDVLGLDEKTALVPADAQVGPYVRTYKHRQTYG